MSKTRLVLMVLMVMILLRAVPVKPLSNSGRPVSMKSRILRRRTIRLRRCKRRQGRRADSAHISSSSSAAHPMLKRARRSRQSE